ncbi:DUF2800 domain-containing protein [Manganibacter manganicus]|uniref:DUF2800 domain-containing protein n=1 Tax=Manganibacter manganicus TaxID=1873176 RepID=A0A1V8RP03_9HYPH|nr:DUF2800 domain-containing protein [Pseudaminobacter manganicus]OQM74917.1 hypothetical protein BFN67_04700 [Pseudaminobacter manganicus]
MTAHARLSPSACDRWSDCTASVAEIEKLRAEGRIPERDSSQFAAEGTVAHEVREMCLQFGLEPYHFVGETISADGFTFVVDDDMSRHLQTGIDWVREHTSSPSVEIKVDLSPWLPGQFGTCDTGFIAGDLCTISDLKFGAGEPVDAVGNKQLRLYALGYWHFKGRPAVKSVLMNIDQPRAGGMKFWEISLEELIEFGEKMKLVYADIAAGRVKFAPGTKACRWCPVKDQPEGCAARNKWLLDMIVDEFDDLEGDEPKLLDASTITPERRWHIVKHAAEIRAWLAKLHEDSLQAALDGNPDPGSKAVEGDLGNRYFVDTKKAEALLVEALGDEAYKPREIIGITDIEKKVKPGRRKQGHPETWEELLKLVDRPPGKPKLVPADHAKPALTPLADAFDDLD